MKKLIPLIVIFVFLLLVPKIVSSQTYLSLDTINNENKDSILIEEINKRSILIDKIHSEGELAIKTPSMDETGSIEIKEKKLDDVWYRIYGSFAIFSKDAFIGHFSRKNFIYVNNMNETVITGKTTDTNIGYITRIRCSFDDIMNVMSGTCYIPVNEQDTISSEDDGSVIVIKSGEKTKKYWVSMSDYTVTKYIQYDEKNDVYLSVEFSNFVKAGNSNYAKRIVIQRPAKREKLTLALTEVNLNQGNLSFYVEVPSDYRKIRW
jgi:hypothetical protein